tara:strand:+ start:564 stop:812 length:249 start_codon:yes stop_codon:yes gene_type:complete
MLKFEQSPEEEFWSIRMNRYVDEIEGKEELRTLAKLLISIATTRQTVIKGLIKEVMGIDTSQHAISTKAVSLADDSQLDGGS